MLLRGDEPSPTRSSVLVRLGHSHIRFGTFQRYATSNERARCARLLDFVVEHYLPEAAGGGRRRPPSSREVRDAAPGSARAWMVAGFVHGVLNTDNMNVTGESFDYGPYRFLPDLRPRVHRGLFRPAPASTRTVGSRRRRVEPRAARRRRSACSARAPASRRRSSGFAAASTRGAGRRRFLARLGVASRGPDDDAALGAAVFQFLAESRVGYEQFFFDWYGGAASAARALASPASAHYAEPRFTARPPPARRPRSARPGAPRGRVLPASRPCTLLIDEIEALWDAIAARDDWSLFTSKLEQIDAMRVALAFDVSAAVAALA